MAHGGAGTVSGAPKVRAMELIAELEKEKRGVYAGAVGYFGYGSVDGEREIEGAMDVSRKLLHHKGGWWVPACHDRVLTDRRRRALHCEQCWSRTASLIFKLGSVP